jgi:hypothetical protein
MAPPRKYELNASAIAFRDFLESRGWDQNKAAEMLHVDLRTIRRYAGGDTIPGPIKRIINVVYKHKLE